MQYHRIKCRFRDERMVRGTSLCPHAHCRAHWNMFFFRIQKDAVFSTRCTLRLVWLMVAAFSEGSSHFLHLCQGSPCSMKMLKQIGVCYFVIQTSSSGNFISVNLMNRPQCSVFTFHQHLIHYAHVYYRLYLKDGHSHYGFLRWVVECCF